MQNRFSLSVLAALFGAVMLIAGPSVADAKGGHGRGHGHGHHMKVHKMHHGWHQGRKVGWRGHGCPPGLARQGRC